MIAFFHGHPGNMGECVIHFFARPYSTASLMSSFSIVFSEQALEFFNLLYGGSKFRGRNDMFPGGHRSKVSLLVLLAPEK